MRVGEARETAGNESDRAVELARQQLVLQLLGHRLRTPHVDGRIALRVRLDEPEPPLLPACQRQAHRERPARLLEPADRERVLRGLERDTRSDSSSLPGLGQLHPSRRSHSKIVAPISRSSCCICRDSAGWVMNSRTAARPMWPSSATTTNDRK